MDRGRRGGRLPRGRHGMADAEVAADQRRRLRAAARELFAERGFALTARQIASRAHVSSSALYRHFDNADGVLFAAFEEEAAALLARVESAPGEEAPSALAAAFAAEPGGAAVLGPGAAIGVAAIALSRQRLLERLGDVLAPVPRRTGTAPLLAAASLSLLAGDEGGVGRAAELTRLLALVGH